jgi:hypothetical protein
MNSAKAFWEKPLSSSTAASGKRCATAAAAAACTSSRMRTPARSIRPTSRANCSTAAPASNAPIIPTASAVADCVKLDPAKLDELEWLPTTCAYRLRYEGKPLPDWHYLISGSRETVHEAGSRRAAGRSAKSMPASWNIILSTAALSPIRSPACRPGRTSQPSARAAPAARARRAARRLRLTCPRGSAAARRSPGRAASATGSRRSSRGSSRASRFGIRARPSRRRREIWLQWDEAAPRTPRCRGDRAALRRPEEAFRPDRTLAAREARDGCRGNRRICRARRSHRVAPVSVGDAGTRWGSCSASGRDPLQLAADLAPPHVRATSSRMKSRTAST